MISTRNTVTLALSGLVLKRAKELRTARAERRATLWAVLVLVACAAMVLT